jgi:CheY-like chemotaxis protein
MATKSIVILRAEPMSPTFGLKFFAATNIDGNSRHGHSEPGRPVGKQENRTGVKRIAIVDDEEDLLAVYSMMVKSWGHRVEFTGSDGTDLVKAFVENKIQPDIVLLDHRMRAMNGLEAAKRIRASHPSIRIVIVSADDSVREEAIRAGFIFLQKPFSRAKLKDILNDL